MGECLICIEIPYTVQTIFGQSLVLLFGFCLFWFDPIYDPEPMNKPAARDEYRHIPLVMDGGDSILLHLPRK